MTKKIAFICISYAALSFCCIASPVVMKIELKKTTKDSIVVENPSDVVNTLRVNEQKSYNVDALILSWTSIGWGEVSMFVDYLGQNENAFRNLTTLDLSNNFDLFEASETELSAISRLFDLRPSLKFVDLSSAFFGARSTKLEKIRSFYKNYIAIQSSLPVGKFIIFMNQWRRVFDENKNQINGSEPLSKIIKAHDIYFSNFYINGEI